MVEDVRLGGSVGCYYPAESGGDGPHHNIVNHDSTIKQIMISRQANLITVNYGQ